MTSNRKLHKTIDDIEYKHCYKCNEWLLLSNYAKNKNVWDGLDRNCKSCTREYRIKNKEQLRERKKIYRENHKQERKEWLENNKEQQKEYNKAYHKKYRNEHSEELREYFRKRYQEKKSEIHEKIKQRMRNDPKLKLARNLRSRINKALTYNIKSKRTMELLGCTIDEFKLYLENQFKDGMTWENYGLYGWHVDHIKPCSLFDLSIPDEQLKCFHYTNMQPLWAKDNIRKSNNYISDQEDNDNTIDDQLVEENTIDDQLVENGINIIEELLVENDINMIEEPIPCS